MEDRTPRSSGETEEKNSEKEGWRKGCGERKRVEDNRKRGKSKHRKT